MKYFIPTRQPQRRMNPALRDIVKQELQKLLDVNFIYPISNSEWVSPLIITLYKNGKWRICVDYVELNKATQKNYFPFPFIDQFLSTHYQGRNTSLSLMVSADITKSKLLLKIRIRRPLATLGVHFHTVSFLLGYSMHLLLSSVQYWALFMI